MSITKFKPRTPSSRHTVVVKSDDLSPYPNKVKSLIKKLSRSKGRNNLGRITSRRRGGGAKRRYRLIDFKRNKLGVPARVVAIEYDPNRTSLIALLFYKDGDKRYILAPEGLKVGDNVVSSDDADIKVGNSRKLQDIPVGIVIHNIELYPGKGGQLARSAGTSARLMAKEGLEALLKLSSGELRNVKLNCRATIGQVSYSEKELSKLGKAGRNRHLSKRPKVRGVAMNPIDHPHGGGEGRTSGGRHPVTPWGKSTKGLKTRHNKRTDKFIVKRRTKKRRN